MYPTFLFALAALAIPIIIHLFYFRRFKRVYFTNVRFLREVKEETSARSKLRNLLVLAMRLLAVAFLVFAFAQPFIPQDVEVKTGRKAVSLFIDNSFSMQALSQDVPLLDKAKQRAREIVEAYRIDDEFQILTNDFEGRRQRLVGKEDALNLIDEIEISPAVRELSTVLERQRQALNTGNLGNQVAYQISDFQKNITDLVSLQDTSVEVNLIPLQAVQERNVSIDSAWFEAPVPMMNQTNALVVQLKNLSDEEVDNVRLSLRYEGQSKPVGTLAIPAGATIVDTVNITILRTGWHRAELAITDYPVQFDDRYYVAFNVPDEINTLVISEEQPNPYLTAAFSGFANFQLVNQLSTNLDYSQFSNYELIVLNELINISSGLSFELRQYVENGGNLLIFPDRNANVPDYRQFLSGFPANELTGFEDQERQVVSVNTEEFIFRDVYDNADANLKLPVSQGNFRTSRYSRGEEPLLTYRDGSSYLSKYQVGEGHLYLSTAPLDESLNNLVLSGEIFIPMLYKMAISAGKQRQIAYTIGRDEVIETPHQGNSSDIVYKLKGEQEEFIPEQRVIGSKVFLGVNNQILEAGYFDLFLDPEEVLAEFAFNYDRKESDLEYYSGGELRSLVGDLGKVIEVSDNSILTAQIEERSQGIVLWRWCILLALLFLGAEVLLLRFWKV